MAVVYRIERPPQYDIHVVENTWSGFSGFGGVESAPSPSVLVVGAVFDGDRHRLDALLIPETEVTIQIEDGV